MHRRTKQPSGVSSCAPPWKRRLTPGLTRWDPDQTQATHCYIFFVRFATLRYVRWTGLEETCMHARAAAAAAAKTPMCMSVRSSRNSEYAVETNKREEEEEKRKRKKPANTFWYPHAHARIITTHWETNNWTVMHDSSPSQQCMLKHGRKEERKTIESMWRRRIPGGVGEGSPNRVSHIQSRSCRSYAQRHWVDAAKGGGLLMA